MHDQQWQMEVFPLIYCYYFLNLFYFICSLNICSLNRKVSFFAFLTIEFKGMDLVTISQVSDDQAFTKSPEKCEEIINIKEKPSKMTIFLVCIGAHEFFSPEVSLNIHPQF